MVMKPFLPPQEHLSLTIPLQLECTQSIPYCTTLICMPTITVTSKYQLQDYMGVGNEANAVEGLKLVRSTKIIFAELKGWLATSPKKSGAVPLKPGHGC